MAPSKPKSANTSRMIPTTWHRNATICEELYQ